MQPEPRSPESTAGAVLWRSARVTLATLAGGLAGWAVGEAIDHPGSMAVLGALLGVLPVALLDAVRASRVLRWLRLGGEGPAAEMPGRWGEAGYRIERLLRMSRLEVRQEQERLQRFRSAIEASPNGVLMLDAEDEILWCNSVAALHFGLDPQRDLRQRVTNLVRAPAFVAYLQAGAYEQPIVFAGPGGATLSVLVRSYGEGQHLVLSQDVTEHLRNEAMRRDFVANVSHEIRTPLTVLAGFVETLAALPLSESERQRVLTLMEQQTRRMQSLVDDLLTLAQLEGSPWPGTDHWHAVHELLQHVEADARALSAGRHTIVVDEGDGGELSGSRTELISAIGNLVNNAVRYTPKGGTLTVAYVRREAGGAEIAVTDTGPGIAREHLSRLTERFYRVDSSRSRETGGTGLGLAIVKHVAQRHGGELVIDSEPGKGSRFRLVLPAGRVRAAAAEPQRSSVGAAAG